MGNKRVRDCIDLAHLCSPGLCGSPTAVRFAEIFLLPYLDKSNFAIRALASLGDSEALSSLLYSSALACRAL